PGFVCRRHLRRLFLRSRWTPRTTPTPATTATVLRFRGRRHHCCLLPRHPLGNGLWRTARTTRAPLPSALPAPTGLRLRLPRGDAAEQRLDRGADFLLNQVTDHRHEASLSRHRLLLAGRQIHEMASIGKDRPVP